MQEGIESEAASIAGTWKLGKLIVIYDKNNITIEGDTDVAFTEDVGARHIAQGWQVLRVDDGEDMDGLIAAINEAKKETDKPSLIIVRTRIGHGSAKEGSAESHGAPLGAELTEKMKKDLGYNYPPFTVAKEVYDDVAKMQVKFDTYEAKWNKLRRSYARKYPADSKLLDAFIRNDFSKALTDDLWQNAPKSEATRNSSGSVLNAMASIVPNLVGGAADLAPSTKTYMKGLGDYGAASRDGRNIHFGIREHAMSAICNGIYLHGGLRPYCSTFFVFSDYMKNGMRMSAIMNIPVIYVLTHDSIGVGEDGPTHEPVEHLAGLRAMPNLKVFRPADRKETVAAYYSAITGKSPACIVCSRQNLPQLDESGKDALKGGYVVYGGDKKPNLILMASGSEVSLAIEAAKILEQEGKAVRVVSMPCMELFDAQSARYKSKVLPTSVSKRVAIEAGVDSPWFKYVGLKGKVIGINEFGESGKAEVLMEKFGFTVDNVVKVSKEVLK
jgi:transketolase